MLKLNSVKMEAHMNNIKGRKYARTSKRKNSETENNDTELTLSSAAALGILVGGTFLVGVISGKLLNMCKK